MNDTMRRTVLLISGISLLAASAVGGRRSDVRGMGMAFAHTASARGLDAVGVNPANLALPAPGMVELSLLPVSVHLGSEFLNYRLYSDYFTGVETDSGRVGHHLTDADKQQLLSAFREDAPQTRMDAEGRLFGVAVRLRAVGAFAFTITDAASGAVDLSRDLASFIFYGNTPGSDYRFSSTMLRASWHREYALSFATAVPAFRSAAAGVTVKLVHGYGVFDVDRFDARLVTDAIGTMRGSVSALFRSAGGLSFDDGATLFPRPSGAGFGMDAGFTARVHEAVTVGVALTDIGSIRWTSGVRETYAETTLVVDEALREDQRRAIEDVLAGRIREGADFTTALPARGRLGVAVEVQRLLEVPGELLVCAEYEQGFRSTPHSTVIPRGALGVEFRPVHWLPLRTGVSAGGTDGLSLAFGLGVDFDQFELALASENATWVVQPGSFSWWSLAAGMKVRI